MDSKIIILLAFIFFWGPLQSQDNYGLAKKAAESGQYNIALNHLNNIPDIEEDQRALSFRGKLYYRTNDLDRTIRDLTRARKLGYDDPEVYWIMGQTMHHKGIYNEAIYFYKSFLTKTDQERPLAVRARIEVKNCV